MSRRSRGRGRSELVTIYWRDIPAQVTAHAGATREQALMSERFQVAIDRAAGVAGLTSTDDYVNEWRKVAEPLDAEADPRAQADARVAELDAAFPSDTLKAYVAAGGLTPDSPAS